MGRKKDGGGGKKGGENEGVGSLHVINEDRTTGQFLVFQIRSH